MNKILVCTDPSILLVRTFIKRNYFVIQVYYVSRVVTVAALLILMIAVFYSVRLAVADAAFRKQTPEGVARASGTGAERSGGEGREAALHAHGDARDQLPPEPQ